MQPHICSLMINDYEEGGQSFNCDCFLQDEMRYHRSANRWEGVGGFLSAIGHNSVSAGCTDRKSACILTGFLSHSSCADVTLSLKEDLDCWTVGLTWPSLAVLGEKLLVHFPLLLLLLDLGVFVDLLDGFGALVGSP